MKDTQGNMENNSNNNTTVKSEDFVVLTDNSHLQMTDDKYTDSIELSNACRQFYQSRMRATEAVKEKLASSGRQRSTKKKNSIDVAMETLRTEMASLMDQDLSLMKQLLTLNEAIEDLKWQRQYYHSQTSVPDSSCDLNESDWSVSETDMYESEPEVPEKSKKTSALPVQARLIGTIEETENIDTLSHTNTNTNSQKLSTQQSVAIQKADTSRFLPGNLDLFLSGNISACHEEQNSFDSGIHEPVLRKEITV